MKMPRFSLLAFAIVLPVLAACGPTSLGMLSTPQVNITASNYGAADMLLQQSQAKLSQHTVLALGALQDLKVPNSKAPFGRIIASQVGARFVQLGYNVHMPDDIGTVSAGDMPAAPATPVMKAPLDSAASSASKGVSVGNTQAMITGHYARSGDEVMINIRIVDMGSGQIWGSYDYAMPFTNEVFEMMSQPPAPQPVVNTVPNTGAVQPAEKKGFFDF